MPVSICTHETASQADVSLYTEVRLARIRKSRSQYRRSHKVGRGNSGHSFRSQKSSSLCPRYRTDTKTNTTKLKLIYMLYQRRKNKVLAQRTFLYTKLINTPLYLSEKRGRGVIRATYRKLTRGTLYGFSKQSLIAKLVWMSLTITKDLKHSVCQIS